MSPPNRAAQLAAREIGCANWAKRDSSSTFDSLEEKGGTSPREKEGTSSGERDGSPGKVGDASPAKKAAAGLLQRGISSLNPGDESRRECGEFIFFLFPNASVIDRERD